MKRHYCFDPLKTHFKRVCVGVRKVTDLFIQRGLELGVAIPEESYLCNNCSVKLSRTTQEDCPSSGSSQSTSQGTSQPENLSGNLPPVVKKLESLHVLENLGVTPPAQPKTKAGKIEAAQEMFRINSNLLVDNVCTLYDLEKEEIIEQKIGPEFEELLSQVKELLKTSARRDKIRLLTLTPSSWSLSFAAQYFEVSRYYIRKATELRKTKGVLADPGPVTSKRVKESLLNLVRNFYESSDNSRVMPGAKDKVSLGKGVSKQKILLLCNLKELFILFKKDYPEEKISFSLFGE